MKNESHRDGLAIIQATSRFALAAIVGCNLLFSVSIALGRPAAANRSPLTPNENLQKQPSKTSLQVTQFTGEFQHWVDKIQISFPAIVSLFSTTTEQGVVAARYEVSTTPWPVSIMASMALGSPRPNIVASGILGVSASGSIGGFHVDFHKFAPATPPKKPDVLNYYIRVLCLDASHKTIGAPSPSVHIVYAEAPPPPKIYGSYADPEKIIFVSTRDGNAEIYKMRLDGSDQVRLTNNSLDDRAPAWNSAHTKIAFERAGQIFVMNADGTEATRLTHNSNLNSLPRWSPDGTKIAFSSRRDGNYDLFIMNADGSNERRLTMNSASDDVPSWSPDGSRIAFMSIRDGAWQIYSIGADGSGEKRLTFSAGDGASDQGPAWAPDGRIAFHRKGPLSGVFIMNSDGSNIQPYGGYYPPLNMAVDSSYLDFGPDGSLVFSMSTQGASDIFRQINGSSGSEVKRLTDFGPNINNIEPNY